MAKVECNLCVNGYCEYILGRYGNDDTLAEVVDFQDGNLEYPYAALPVMQDGLTRFLCLRMYYPNLVCSQMNSDN